MGRRGVADRDGAVSDFIGPFRAGSLVSRDCAPDRTNGGDFMRDSVQETPVLRRARDLYAVYCASSDGKNYQGLPCPVWDALTEAVRGHWYTVALRTEQLQGDPNALTGDEAAHAPTLHVLGRLADPAHALMVWRGYSGIE